MAGSPIYFIVIIVYFCTVITCAVKNMGNLTTENELGGSSQRNINEHMKRIKWTPKLNFDLLDIHDKMHPYGSYNSSGIHEQWKSKYPQYSNITPNYLKRHLKNLLHYEKNTLGGHHGENEEHLKKRMELLTSMKRQKWTPEMNSNLLKIWHDTFIGFKGHQARTHQRWSELYPQYSHISPKNLIKQVAFLIAREKKGGPHKTFFPWTNEMDEKLLNLWHKCLLQREPLAIKLQQMWNTEHPEYAQLKPNTLFKRAKRLHEKWSNIEPQVPTQLRTRIKWTDELDRELINLWRKFLPQKSRVTKLHQTWITMHPEYARVSPQTLFRRVKVLYQERQETESQGHLHGIQGYDPLMHQQQIEHHDNNRIHLDDSVDTRLSL